MEERKPFAANVPSNVQTTPDDSLCTLKWNGFPRANADRDATGFEVEWGKEGSAERKKAATPFNAYQCQPLERGAVYHARIRSVDKFGRASAWTDEVTFSSDSARVDAIRKQCIGAVGNPRGGFFDDFNQPQGAFDARKHNFAVTRYSDETVNCFVINAQNHAHLLTSSLRWDRGKVIDRPRAELDISDGGTRTVFLDMDSGVNLRTSWYLDLIPADANNAAIPPYDMSNRSAVSPSVREKADAPGMVRILQTGGKLEIMTADETGALRRPVAVALEHPPAGLPQLTAIPNLRRPWKFTVSKTLVEAYLMDWTDGKYKKVLSAPTHLTWTRARLFNTAFAYNNRKEGLYAWLWHFDNFGFDAPSGAKPAPLVYDYLTQTHSGAEYGGAAVAQKSLLIKIPDAVARWKHTLYFTVSKSNGNQSTFKPGPENTVTVNGKSFPLGVPDDNVRSARISFPPGLVKTGSGPNGDNVIVFSFAGKSGALNVHIEAERPANEAGPPPTYTTHCGIWGCNVRQDGVLTGTKLPTFPLGPDVFITQVGAQSVGSWAARGPWKSLPPIPVSGTVTIAATLAQLSCVAANGVSAPCDHFDFLIDPHAKGTTTAFSLKRDAVAVAGAYKFALDTTKLSNGSHEIFLRGYTAAHIPSNPYYFNQHTENGDYRPIYINVQNGQ